MRNSERAVVTASRHASAVETRRVSAMRWAQVGAATRAAEEFDRWWIPLAGRNDDEVAYPFPGGPLVADPDHAVGHDD